MVLSSTLQGQGLNSTVDGHHIPGEPDKGKAMKRLVSFLIALSMLCMTGGISYAADRGNTSLQSFNKAKKLLLKEVYYDHLITFYCNCPFTMDKKIMIFPRKSEHTVKLP